MILLSSTFQTNALSTAPYALKRHHTVNFSMLINLMSPSTHERLLSTIVNIFLPWTTSQLFIEPFWLMLLSNIFLTLILPSFYCLVSMCWPDDSIPSKIFIIFFWFVTMKFTRKNLILDGRLENLRLSNVWLAVPFDNFWLSDFDTVDVRR